MPCSEKHFCLADRHAAQSTFIFEQIHNLCDHHFRQQGKFGVSHLEKQSELFGSCERMRAQNSAAHTFYFLPVLFKRQVESA